MFFDDRLATVLRQSASSDVGLRTQFRQLLDILGAEKISEQSARDPSLVASAWLRMDALATRIAARDRARIIREPGWRFGNPQLAAHLADHEPDVASAALNRAQLSAEDWTALIPRLPVRARGFLRLRRDLPVDALKLLDRLGVHDRGLPRPLENRPDDESERAPATPETVEPEPLDPEPLDKAARTVEPALVEESDFIPPPPVNLAGIDQDAAPPLDLAEIDPQDTGPTETEATPDPVNTPENEGRSEISALVERIARFKRNREDAPELDDTQPRLPLGEENLRRPPRITGFGFAADAGGRIEWADAEVAPMVIGTRLAAPARLASTTSQTALQRAFIRRQPISGETATLPGAEAISGDWIVDAQPRFTDSGNFAGYAGRFRRVIATDPNQPTPAQREADRIRQLLHELRTPVTAVQGYAEVIQQQLFGPAPHEYRALSAAIAADAARVLAGFEELDRLAKLETGAVEIEPGEADLADITRRTSRQLDQVLHPRMAGLAVSGADTPCFVAIDQDRAEGLIWRLLATLGGGCSAGEMLNAELGCENNSAVLTCDLPAQLLAGNDIFTAEAKPLGGAINVGLFGAGFALRLVRAEARTAGGDLVRDDTTVILRLPLLGKEGVMTSANHPNPEG